MNIDALVPQVRRRLQALGAKGNHGGWLRIPRTTRNVQGWREATRWAVETAAKLQDANLAEIRDGTRIGTPTLQVRSGKAAAMTALALVTPGPVLVRITDEHGNDTPLMLR